MTSAAFVSKTQPRSLVEQPYSFPTPRHDPLRDSLRIRLVPVPKEDIVKIPEEDFDVFDSHESKVQNEQQSTKVTQQFLGTIREAAPTSSILLLNLVAVIWGAQHAVIKMVVSDSDAAPFTLLRFGLAALIASPYLPIYNTANDTDCGSSGSKGNAAWRWGIEMGFWMFLGFSLQAIGLETTTAQRSGFLLYLNVKLVPLFARVFLGRSISVPTWVSAFAAFSGTALLALDGKSLAWNEGDLWSIAAAASSAMFILRLERASKEVPNSAELNASCLVVVAIFSVVWTIAQNELSLESLSSIFLAHPVELLYLGGVSTALANYIQAKAQKDVPAERASIIYSLDPVYGAFFSWVLLGESLGGVQAYLGAALITVAAATNAFLDLGRKDNSITD